jgi:hypothetical protein
MKTETLRERLLRIDARVISGLAIVELAVSQFHIRMTRLSAEEMTGISLFAFIIFSMVSLFAVTRMGDSPGGKFFAAAVNGITAFAAIWYLRLLFHDEIFFKNLYFVLNRQTREYDPLPLAARISASVPLALIIAGTAIYCLSALLILLAAALPLPRSGKQTA